MGLVGGQTRSNQKTSFIKKFSKDLRNLNPDVQIPNPKFAFYQLMLRLGDLKNARDRWLAHYEGLDILVHNAAIYEKPIPETDPDEFQNQCSRILGIYCLRFLIEF